MDDNTKKEECCDKCAVSEKISLNCFECSCHKSLDKNKEEVMPKHKCPYYNDECPKCCPPSPQSTLSECV